MWDKNKTYLEPDAPFSFPIIIKPRCETKVSDLDLHLVVDKQVAKLEISVYNVVTVQVLAGFDHLFHEISRFWLRHSFSSLV